MTMLLNQRESMAPTYKNWRYYFLDVIGLALGYAVNIGTALLRLILICVDARNAFEWCPELDVRGIE
jgi:hypothetical protein